MSAGVMHWGGSRGSACRRGGACLPCVRHKAELSWLIRCAAALSHHMCLAEVWGSVICTHMHTHDRAPNFGKCASGCCPYVLRVLPQSTRNQAPPNLWGICVCHAGAVHRARAIDACVCHAIDLCVPCRSGTARPC